MVTRIEFHQPPDIGITPPPPPDGPPAIGRLEPEPAPPEVIAPGPAVHEPAPPETPVVAAPAAPDPGPSIEDLVAQSIAAEPVDFTKTATRFREKIDDVQPAKDETYRGRPSFVETMTKTLEGKPALNVPELIAENLEGHCAEEGCTVVVALKPSAHHGGRLACAWHDPERRRQRDVTLEVNRMKKKLQETRLEPSDLPVREIRTIDDALIMARWIPTAVALGLLDTKQAAVMISAIREYRMIEVDATSSARLKALQEQVDLLKHGERK